MYKYNYMSWTFFQSIMQLPLSLGRYRRSGGTRTRQTPGCYTVERGSWRERQGEGECVSFRLRLGRQENRAPRTYFVLLVRHTQTQRPRCKEQGARSLARARSEKPEARIKMQGQAPAALRVRIAMETMEKQSGAIVTD